MKSEKIILDYAKMNMQREEVAQLMNCSSKKVGRICKEKFNHTYKELQFLMILAGIYEMRMKNVSSQEIADKYFHGNKQQLYAYVGRFSEVPLKRIKIEGGHRMTQEQKLILEAQVITKLVNSQGKNITLKQLGVPRCIIESLRRKGYDIISVPGRYNGGYNLGKTSKKSCLSWINKIRKNRFHLSADYTF